MLINKLAGVVLMLALKLVPMNRKYVFFSSFHGMYNDNCKYISEQLHRTAPQIKCIWEVDERCHREHVPAYVVQCNTGSLIAKYLRSRSKAVVENYLGLYYSYYDKVSISQRIIKIWKKHGQFNLTTWHGTPMKKACNEEPKSVHYSHFWSTSDVMLSGCSFTEEFLKRNTFGQIPIARTGTPRNDVFFQSNVNIESIKEKLHIPSGKRVLLYAPTFRDDNSKNGVLLTNSDIHAITSSLSQRFGGEWVIVYRSHDSLLFNGRSDILKLLVSGNAGDDMAEYLMVSDILITDYSSCAFDFALTKKPCFLYWPDSQYFFQSDRGLYFSKDKLRFPIAETVDEICNLIQAFCARDYEANIQVLLNELGDYEIGEAAQKSVELILHALSS